MPRDFDWRRLLPIVIAVFVAALGGSGLAVVIVDDDPTTPDKTVTTIKLPTSPEEEAKVLDASDRVAAAPVDATGNGKPDDVVVSLEGAVEAADERVEEGADRKDPAGGAPAVQDAIERNKRATDPLPLGGAFQGFPGCRTRLLTGDSSSRDGVRPVWMEWHYAVIPNLPGRRDLDILFNVFASTSRDASSHFGIDHEGNCDYLVPIERKAWTAVNANPFAISVEIIAMGNERSYCPGPCLTKARQIAQEVKRRTGIPITRGRVSPSNLCVPGSAGHTHHDDHKSCGGAHVDIKPFSIDAFIRQLSASATTLSALERKLVRSARAPKGTGHSRRYWCQRIDRQIAWLARSARVDRRAGRLRILRRVARGACG